MIQYLVGIAYYCCNPHKKKKRVRDFPSLESEEELEKNRQLAFHIKKLDVETRLKILTEYFLLNLYELYEKHDDFYLCDNTSSESDVDRIDRSPKSSSVNFFLKEEYPDIVLDEKFFFGRFEDDVNRTLYPIFVNVDLGGVLKEEDFKSLPRRIRYLKTYKWEKSLNACVIPDFFRPFIIRYVSKNIQKWDSLRIFRGLVLCEYNCQHLIQLLRCYEFEEHENKIEQLEVLIYRSDDPMVKASTVADHIRFFNTFRKVKYLRIDFLHYAPPSMINRVSTSQGGLRLNAHTRRRRAFFNRLPTFILENLVELEIVIEERNWDNETCGYYFPQHCDQLRRISLVINTPEYIRRNSVKNMMEEIKKQNIREKQLKLLRKEGKKWKKWKKKKKKKNKKEEEHEEEEKKTKKRKLKTVEDSIFESDRNTVSVVKKVVSEEIIDITEVKKVIMNNNTKEEEEEFKIIKEEDDEEDLDSPLFGHPEAPCSLDERLFSKALIGESIVQKLIKYKNLEAIRLFGEIAMKEKVVNILMNENEWEDESVVVIATRANKRTRETLKSLNKKNFLLVLSEREYDNYLEEDKNRGISTVSM